MRNRKILVIGLGPCGGIFAAYLAKAGYSVYGLDSWGEHSERIRRDGVKVTNFISLQVPLREVFTSFGELRESDFDYVVIAVKTPDLADVVSELKVLRGDFQVVVMQNGLDNEDYPASFFPRERVHRVTISYGGNILYPGVIKMNFFQAPNYIGCACDETNCRHSDEFTVARSRSL